MREVEKSEGNYMSRERPIGNLGRQNRGNEQTTKGQTKTFLVISEEEKSKKKNVPCLLYTRCLLSLIHI